MYVVTRGAQRAAVGGVFVGGGCGEPFGGGRGRTARLVAVDAVGVVLVVLVTCF